MECDVKQLHEEYLAKQLVYTIIELKDGTWEVEASHIEGDIKHKTQYTRFSTHAEAVNFCEAQIDKETE